MATVEELRAEVNELHELNGKLGSLLERTANALKGLPGPLHMHDWSDLPDVAARIRTERDLLHAQVQRLVDEREKGIKKAPRDRNP